ncbi:type II toxin-antitoxin system VapC family toxin [Streptosporangium subroseum]|uniref:type II toxin-antitoxin system VapC family toxin n=1 Tax=Streptosporangium subroseum TaxID=106412 RepID=UPI0030895FBF|nr:PIN domain-containing protein [Streptosporangium subroseum]
MGTVVLDSCILLGLFDPKDALHLAAAGTVRERRLRSDRLAVPIIVSSEILVGAARQGEPALKDRLRRLIRAFGTPVPIDLDIAVTAARLRAAHSALRLPDALVLATGIVLDAEMLSADKKWPKIDPRVTLVEPGVN